MGKRGPPPKPSALKKAQGTYRKSRAAQNEIQPPPGVPPCPSHLGQIGKEEWYRIVPELERLGVMTMIDRVALEGYCANYSLARQYQEIAEAEPMVEVPMQTKGGGVEYVIKPNPAAGQARKHWALVKQFGNEFGLSPSSRTRVGGSGDDGASGKADKDSAKGSEAFLFGAGAATLKSIPGGRSGHGDA